MNSESGSNTRVATVTEQQEQFIQEMLQAIANGGKGEFVFYSAEVVYYTYTIIFNIIMLTIQSIKYIQSTSHRIKEYSTFLDELSVRFFLCVCM